jgi:hypothetical protein
MPYSKEIRLIHQSEEFPDGQSPVIRKNNNDNGIPIMMPSSNAAPNLIQKPAGEFTKNPLLFR